MNLGKRLREIYNPEQFRLKGHQRVIFILYRRYWMVAYT